LVAEAEAHANEDRARREAADARNEADHAVYQIDKQLGELGDNLSDEEKAPIADAIAEVRKLLEDPAVDPKTLREATQGLLTKAQVLGEKVYEQAQAASGESGAGDDGDDDGVVEAEIVDEGDEG
jgi:molecular chaperone DnaK